MQNQMKSTYEKLSSIKLTGQSEDGSVVITITATYEFLDIEFGEKALVGGVKEFKLRIKDAWKNAISQVQQATQNKTMELLQGMQIPDEIRNISTQQQDDDDKDK